jgi:carbonic anhydrase
VDVDQLLERNREWAKRTDDSSSLPGSRKDRDVEPDVFWIGCADSRVAPSVVTDVEPGRLFVHRNLANLALPADANFLSVLQFAVDELRVNHVVVCGHTDCAHMDSVLNGTPHDYEADWLQEMKMIHRAHEEELDAIEDDAARRDRLSELNVKHQVDNVAGTRIVREAREEGRGPAVHGLILRLDSGLLDEVVRDVTTSPTKRP